MYDFCVFDSCEYALENHRLIKLLIRDSAFMIIM